MRTEAKLKRGRKRDRDRESEASVMNNRDRRMMNG